ncbi:MAG: hypothetical protein WC340_18195, partial [Kiritimatiellia bacterium]
GSWNKSARAFCAGFMPRKPLMPRNDPTLRAGGQGCSSPGRLPCGERGVWGNAQDLSTLY